MHEMRKSEAVQHHPHKHVDGRKEVYGVHKMTEKDRHKSSSHMNRSDRDHRTSKSHGVTSQIPGAIRICGEWSEHLSSNGKVYFFNNKTKLSQWERPKEWSSSRSVEVKSKDKVKSSHLHQKVASKHASDVSSSSAGSSQHAALRQHKSYSQISEAKKQQQRHRTNHEPEFKDRDYRTLSSSTSAKDRDYRDIDYRDSNSSRSESRLSNSVDAKQKHDRDYRSSGDKSTVHRQTSSSYSRINSQTSKDYNDKNSTSNESHESFRRSNSQVDKVSRANYNDGARLQNSKEDGSRSNSTTPRSSSDAVKRDWQGEKRGSVDSNDSHESATVANGGGEDSSSTSALVQTLSNVLNQAGTSSENAADTSIEGNLKSALQMLLDAAVRNQHISNNAPEEVESVEAAKSDEPATKRKRTTSTVAEDHLSNSLLVSQNAEKVLSSLRSSLDERYISHVQGWPADQLEKQSTRLCDENHSFIVNHISELSATMKIARSQVRASEIHSTLQEQRILYLRQQITDLEKSTTIAPFT